VLVACESNEQSHEKTIDNLEELAFLSETAGFNTLRIFTQKLIKPNGVTYVGSGKLDEIADFIRNNPVGFAVFDDELSPTQLRNIEDVLQVRILDRTHLILDIFAMRAKTSYAKAQVELAQYQYLLPRLTRMWTHLERQRGGIGLRGPGETEIETDRRVIRDKISALKDQLVQIDKQMSVQRKNRTKIIRVALVGYTNAGKSTIMNLLSKSDLLAENRLFATLDTTTRKVVINNLPFLLSDTVGFIRKLPHQLIESFKSTLDEIRESDLLVHVVDVSHKNYQEQIITVRNTLAELNLQDKSVLLVFNKIDNIDDKISTDDLQKSWIAYENTPCIFISAKQGLFIDEFRGLLFELVKKIHFDRYPYNAI